MASNSSPAHGNTQSLSDREFISGISNNKPNSVLSGDELLLITQVLLLITMAVAVLGVVTNLVNIVTFFTMKIEDGVTMVFLVIAIFDLTFVILVLVRNLAFLLRILERKANECWFSVDPELIFFIFALMDKIAFTATALSSTFMAVARCMCVARPLHFRNMFTKVRCLIVLIICAIFPAVFAIPHFSTIRIKEKFNAVRNSSRFALSFAPDKDIGKNLTRLVLDNFLLFFTEIIVIVCVIVLTVSLRQAAHFRASQKTDQTKADIPRNFKLTGKDLKVVTQVTIISTIYTICNIPKICHSMFDFFDPRFDFGKPYYSLFLALLHLNTFFAVLNSSINFFVYYSYNGKFRSVCCLSNNEPEIKSWSQEDPCKKKAMDANQK